MQARRIVLAAAAATALAVAPLSVASAHTGHHAKPHAAFVVAGVSVQGHHRVFNVASAPATVNIKVKLRDYSATLDPTGVTLTLTEKLKGADPTTFTVAATMSATKTVKPHFVYGAHHKRHTEKGYVVTTWIATVNVAQGAVDPGAKAKFSVTKVNVDPTGNTANKHYKAGHHHSCFQGTTFLVVNRAPKV